MIDLALSEASSIVLSGDAKILLLSVCENISNIPSSSLIIERGDPLLY